MKKSKSIIFLLCGIVFGLTAFPVFAQTEKTREINIRPLQDFAAYLKDKIKEGEVDLKQSFKVVLKGVLTEDGRFDKKRSKFTFSEGDAKIVDIVKFAIEAAGDTQIFGYLRDSGVEEINLVVSQNDSDFVINLSSEQPTTEKAKKVASGFSSLIQILLQVDRNDIRKLKESAKLLLNGTKSVSEGKVFILETIVPKAAFHEMLLRELNESKDNNTTGE